MKLLLTSGGITNKSISDALFELAGKPAAELNLVFVPTAANTEEGDKGWLINDLYNCKKLGLSSIEITDISAVPAQIWKPSFEKADILLFGGGNPFYLMHWLKKTGLKEMLPEMLKTKIYVGISAGSMAVTKNLCLSQSKKLYYLEGVGEFKDETGLGLVDFLVRPHLNSPDFSNVRIETLKELAKEIPETIYAIDDDTAIKVVDDEISVISEGEWKKFN